MVDDDGDGDHGDGSRDEGTNCDEGDGDCISCFSVAGLKHHDQTQLKKESLFRLLDL